MTATLPNLPPNVLRQRLAALVASQGIRFNELAKRMGRPTAWVYQRLSPTCAKSKSAIPLNDADCADIIKAAEIDAERLNRPVLYFGDYAAMTDLLAEPRLIRLAKDRYGRTSIKRMLHQDLIAEEGGRYHVTEVGHDALKRHATEPGVTAARTLARRRVTRFATVNMGRIYLSRGLLWLVNGDVASQVVADTGADPLTPTPGIGPLRRTVTLVQGAPVFSGEAARPQTVTQIVNRLCRRPGESS